ncbi:rhodanese-like domain-containing protein [Geotalea toluenoxydans]|uniref:rhodanese-like domain-containing protein n=1 Tax=Geotalea toluenoxydans TaxID=421624 RepID=UPI0006CFB043|nr:rhodanese-like domain-containing protein [Geotalea toluenoxydans]
MIHIKEKIQLFGEMAIIFILASTIGITWNHQLLRDVLAGKPVQSAGTSETSPQPTAATTPLPLGLQQTKELYDRREATLVDARDKTDFAAGHIKGALSLPLGDFDASLARFKGQVKPDATLIVYCNGFDCHDSMDLGNRLIKAGYGNVYVFLGGFPEWKDAGYAVEGGKP